MFVPETDLIDIIKHILTAPNWHVQCVPQTDLLDIIKHMIIALNSTWTTSKHEKVQMKTYLTWIYSMQMFREITFIKPQNDT